ncbi:MAG: LysM peptidoglycan-binding domain-containing protein [Bacteroidota bacterium]
MVEPRKEHIEVNGYDAAPLELRIEDVGNLDSVLRGYYLSQIKKLEKRSDRKNARKLIENHLVLPKSRQRTSKDAAFIREKLGIEPLLLEKLENSRLIRRISKRGNNPIYEISHDTLVEPILAGKRDREAIALFLKRIWKWVLGFLLLWFLFGMLVENCFGLIPDPVEAPKTVEVELGKQMFTPKGDYSSFKLPIKALLSDKKINPNDSILINLTLDAFPLDSLTDPGQDTLPIVLPEPVNIYLSGENPNEYHEFPDLVIPITMVPGKDGAAPKQLYGKLIGSVRLNQGTRGGLENKRLSSNPISMNMDTIVQAATNEKNVPLKRDLMLSDFFESEADKNKIRNTLGDRSVSLEYNVQLKPADYVPPPPRTKYVSVQGIEVQYSDGTRRFISPGDGNNDARGAVIGVHKVASGETLFRIAKRYNTTAEEIKRLNNLQGNSISVGQELKIPLK